VGCLDRRGAANRGAGAASLRAGLAQGCSRRARGAVARLEQGANGGVYPAAATPQAPSLGARRSRLLTASHPRTVCRDGGIVVDAERHGTRGTPEEDEQRKREVGVLGRGRDDEAPRLRLSSRMAQTPGIMTRFAGIRVQLAIVPRGIGGVPAQPLTRPREDPDRCRAKTQRTSGSKQALAEQERCCLVAVRD
jgi:hypothetical protein